jgi:hypothetical protein
MRGVGCNGEAYHVLRSTNVKVVKVGKIVFHTSGDLLARLDALIFLLDQAFKVGTVIHELFGPHVDIAKIRVVKESEQE